MLLTTRFWRGASDVDPAVRLRSDGWKDRSLSVCTAAVPEDGVTLASETAGVAGLAQRYAVALFEIADERRALDEVASDLRQLRAMLVNSADLTRLIRSPILSRDAQAKAMAALAEVARLSLLIRNFLMVVARNRRLFAVPAMIEAYLARLAARRGEVAAEVMTARPLDQAQLGQLNEQLRRTVGRRVSIEARVDPTLIGGMIVKVGSRMVDSSIRSQLHRLQLAMKAAG
jgi:F-type H+-transporting ATPase subunit delta